MIHKKISVLLGTMALTTMVYAQQIPTGTPGNSSDWRRGGNLAAPPGLGGTNNIFGTMWNSPIYTVTNGVNRTRLSGNLPAVPALGTTVNLTGHFGIGLNGYFNNPNNPPLTMLHLEGNNNTPIIFARTTSENTYL